MLSDTFMHFGSCEQWRRLISGATGPKRRRLYFLYLRSQAWKQRRAEAIRASGGCCDECGTPHVEEVHHVTYARLGNERLEDLASVCVRCHRLAHTAIDAIEEDDMVGSMVSNGRKVGVAGPGCGHAVYASRSRVQKRTRHIES